jgi:hypothetical protein
MTVPHHVFADQGLLITEDLKTYLITLTLYTCFQHHPTVQYTPGIFFFAKLGSISLKMNEQGKRTISLSIVQTAISLPHQLGEQRLLL